MARLSARQFCCNGGIFLREIIFTFPNLEMGGAERVALTLAGELVGQGWKTILACGRASGPLRREVHPEVELIDLGAGRALAMVRPLRRLLRQHPRALLFSCITHANIVALLSARLLSRHAGPVVVQEVSLLRQGREKENRAKAAVFSLGVRRLYPMADSRLAVSEQIASEFELCHGFTPGTFLTIPNPVDLPRVAAGASQEPGHPWLATGHTGKILLGVGRQSHEKGFDLLLRALALLADRREDLRLLLAGEGPERGRLVKMAQDLGVADKVDFLGVQDNPWQYMGRADALVVPSRAEGFALVLVEALSCGCQVVSTCCGGAPLEILRQGELGELATVEDPDSLAQAILRALETPRPVESLRRRARDFDKALVTGLYQEHFNQLLGSAS